MEDPSQRHTERLSQAIGESIQAYAMVEAHQAAVLKALLSTDFRRAHTIFFAVQSVRSRSELLENLLQLELRSDLQKYWASCSNFLQKLANFRNAIAHWHPHVNVYARLGSAERRLVPALAPPKSDGTLRFLEEANFPRLFANS